MKIFGDFNKIAIALLFFSTAVFGQNRGIYTDQVSIAVPTTGSTTTQTLNIQSPTCTNFKVQDGQAWLALNFGEDYEFGNGLVFDVLANVRVSIITTNPAVVNAIDFEVELDNSNPEAKVFIDLKPFIDSSDLISGLKYSGETISAIKAEILSVNNSAPSPTIDVVNDLKIGLHYEIQNGLEINANTIDALSLTHDASMTPTNKVVIFSWIDSCLAPNYEFQLLRLFNTKNDLPYLTDERLINTEIDWTKALTFQTESSDTSLSITIGEGQGFYVWRVRPIGTFYEGGIANNENWGAWNVPVSYTVGGSNDFLAMDGATPAADLMPTGEVLFFVDLDDNINYQYSRVFTEENKQSEQITYATPLNQVKQTQRYFPSKGSFKVISQTILDNSGRPTLSTLPVPIQNEKLNKYKEQLVTTNGGELYKAKHFDTDTNLNAPSTIDATGAFTYYSNTNTDHRIADAEGYAFSRVVYNNDGTNRVVEQSGVGKTHMLGNQADGQGRTTRTLYGTPTEDELVALFGDEAPQHENVSKIITIDPNNTTSVAYITKEGKTIATGLTFSEDDDVLDQLPKNVDNTIKPSADRMRNNTSTENGFLAAKRITLLEQTDVAIKYTIQRLILEGLCTNLEIDLDYALKVQVFDVATGAVVEELYEPSILDPIYPFTEDVDNITIDFGLVTLDPGTYYVQKTLVPSDTVNAQIVESEDNMRALIEPFFQWVVDRINLIDCEEELRYLYNDIYYFGSLVHNGANGGNGLNIGGGGTGDGGVIIPFGNSGFTGPPCTDCSGLPYALKRKDVSDPTLVPPNPDEFLDYYVPNIDSYGINIAYVNPDGTSGIIEDYVDGSLGNKIPVRLYFSTPCCKFDVPVNYTPGFRVPTKEALEQFKYNLFNPSITDNGNSDLDKQVNNSVHYYDEALLDVTAPPTVPFTLQPNYKFLTETGDNFLYTETKDAAGNVTAVGIDHGDAYPLDFEGYAISMLYECKSSGDSTYEMQEAQDAVYRFMRGWHKPGVFNQMVYHMVSDNYGEIGCQSRLDENGVGGPDFLENGGSNEEAGAANTVIPDNKYHICDIPTTTGKLPGAQYSITELAECWEALVIELVREICIEPLQLQADANNNIAENVDEQDEDELDEHFDENIKNFIVRWISKKKLKKKIRQANINGSASPEEAANMQKGNLVNMFLECTGYAFADILTPVEEGSIATIASNYTDFTSDFDVDGAGDPVLENGAYNSKRLLELDGTTPVHSIAGPLWSNFTLKPTPTELHQLGYLDPSHTDYIGPTDLGFINEYLDQSLESIIATPARQTRVMHDLFPNIKDPVYAFKYFEYTDGTFQSLEMQTCYRDPNMCHKIVRDGNGEPVLLDGEEQLVLDADGKPILVPCCGTVEAPEPCDFCGIGYIECPYTKLDWNCGQRLTFYDMLKFYIDVPEQSGIPINCENYYESTTYVKNPNYQIYIEDGSYTPNVIFQFVSPDYDSVPLDALNDLEFLSQELLDTYVVTPTFDQLANDPDDEYPTDYTAYLYNISGEYVNVSINDPANNVSLVENDAWFLKQDCEGNCDSRREEFKQELIKMFEARCYVIGGCKVDTNDNIVPEEDLDAIVDKLVAQCKLQCPLTSYACENDPCRNINTPITQYGLIEGTNFNITTVDYGVEGLFNPDSNPDVNTNRTSNLVRYDGTNWVDDPATPISSLDVTNSTAPGAIFEKYFYATATDDDYSIWNVRRSMRYPEYSRWIQVMQWKLNLSIKSKCNEQGQYDPVIAMNAEYDGYVYDAVNEAWVSQGFMNCPKPYISTANPLGPGDTFVERDEYIKNSTTPITPDSEVLQPVDSPKIGIEHVVD